jgi:hypothetical protein
MTAIPSPDPAVLKKLEQLARTELSLPARLAHVLLGLVASALTIVVVSLWLTEPSLPARTQIAFGLLTVIGAGWVAYSIWVLTARRVMLARHRVVAGRLAVAFNAVFTIGCVLLALTTGSAAAWPAFGMGLGLLAVAVALWWRAESSHARLVARLGVLERELTGGAR